MVAEQSLVASSSQQLCPVVRASVLHVICCTGKESTRSRLNLPDIGSAVIAEICLAPGPLVLREVNSVNQTELSKVKLVVKCWRTPDRGGKRHEAKKWHQKGLYERNLKSVLNVLCALCIVFSKKVSCVSVLKMVLA